MKEDKSIASNHAEKEDIFDTEIKTQPQMSPYAPWDALTDASYEAVTDLYSNASKRQGNLSARAASMLVNGACLIKFCSLLFSINSVHFSFICYKVLHDTNRHIFYDKA